jgi:hypothetical protein
VISPLFWITVSSRCPAYHTSGTIDEKIAHARAGIETGKSVRGRSPLYSASAILANGIRGRGQM